MSLSSLYARSGAERWGVSSQRFAQALDQSAAKRFPDGPPNDPQELARYFDSLRLEDLALACACADGDEHAWTAFMADHGEALYAAARAIVKPRDEAAAKDLADSLYAELYGVGRATNSHKPSGRRPLFDYFHGRSKLDTWLRAILAQRYIDKLREGAKLVSLDGDEAPPLRTLARPHDHERAAAANHLHEAMSEAVAELASRDKLAVSLYYLRGKTLAEIGRVFGEHESSVSRRLDRTRQEIRKSVEERLRKQGLSGAQVNLCFDCAEEDGPFDLSRSLACHGSSEGSAHSADAGNSRPAHEDRSLRIQLPPGAPPLTIPREEE